MAPEDAKRGWRFDLRIPVPLMGAVALQCLVIVSWGQKLSDRVDHLEQGAQLSVLLPDRVTRLEEQSKAIVNGIDRIERKIDDQDRRIDESKGKR